MPRPPRITAPAPRAGSRKLLAHIREGFTSIPAFATEKGLERHKVEKAIDGRLQRIDVDFAAAIRDATGGVVDIEDWKADPEDDLPASPDDLDTAQDDCGPPTVEAPADV